MPSSEQEPQAASAGTPEPQTPQCTRCCAVRTHFLTCPTLRLPPGYRFSEDQVLATSLVGDVAAAFGEHVLAILVERYGYFRCGSRAQADRVNTGRRRHPEQHPAFLSPRGPSAPRSSCAQTVLRAMFNKVDNLAGVHGVVHAQPDNRRAGRLSYGQEDFSPLALYVLYADVDRSSTATGH